ncbi:MAG TPA: RNA polymerase sigma factor [Pyrinomonadaceae bacterium]|nr:RNA polymerase sigma factor [Pyrinomonadaceae bacterium]
MEIAELRRELEKLHSASFGWARSCCRGNRAEAEEVLQTVYLKILDGKARYRGECQLRTWLFAVIRNTAITERRKALFRSVTAIPATNARAFRVDPNPDPELEFERSETQSRFRMAIERLPDRQRETLHLVFYQDLNLREAAQVMGISIGSARRHYERGKKRLREALDREEGAYGFGWRRKENSGAVL